MADKFRSLGERVLVSPQIDLADIASARARGVELIVNNRPVGEAEDQTPGAEIARAAKAAGLRYISIPVTHAGFSQAQVTAMAEALASTTRPILAYCRSGTRSTFLWALAEASRGVAPEDLAAAAANSGYDLTPVRAMIDMLAGNAR
jgi:uncharacterized protein (TIGR01244 family)